MRPPNRAGTRDDSAQFYFGGKLPEGPYAVRARVKIEPMMPRGLHIVLDWREGSAIGALLSPDECEIAVWQDEKWQDGRRADWLADGDLHGSVAFASHGSVAWVENPRVEPLAVAGK